MTFKPRKPLVKRGHEHEPPKPEKHEPEEQQKKEVLTLEERVARLEELLETHGIRPRGE